MTKAFLSLPPGWVQARRYHLLAPLVALVVMALFEQTWVAELLEDQTVNLRFRARSSFDPPADPRILFLGIDQQSLDKLGKYPWPRYTNSSTKPQWLIEDIPVLSTLTDPQYVALRKCDFWDTIAAALPH